MSLPAVSGGVFATFSYLPTFAEDPYLKVRKAQLDKALSLLPANALRRQVKLLPRQQTLPSPSPSLTRAANEQPNPSFAYLPLENSSHIRLLRLLAPPTKDELNFSLLHYRKVQIEKQYIAVSYCWGRAERSHSLVVNEEKFPVGKNLFNFLLELARQNPVGTLFWADAICINQGDLRERGQEVQHMQTIYNSASVVKAWLGHLHPDIIILVKLIQRLGSLPEDDTQSYRKTQNEWEQLVIDMKVERRLWSAAKQLLHNPYWTRVWIVQEFCVNRRLSIHWGHVELESDSFYTFVHLVRWLSVLEPKRLQEGRLRVVTKLAAIRKDYQAGRFRDLLKLIEDTAFAQSSDPRDKVFGLLGLATDGQHWIPHPDYEASLVDLRVAMTQNYIRRQQSLNIILSGPPPSEMPSFCPDYFRVGYPSLSWNHRLSPLANDKQHHTPSLELIDGPVKVLRVRGSVVATIEILGWTYGDGNETAFPRSTGSIISEDVPFQELIYNVLDSITYQPNGLVREEVNSMIGFEPLVSATDLQQKLNLRIESWILSLASSNNPNPILRERNVERLQLSTSTLTAAVKETAKRKATEEISRVLIRYRQQLKLMHVHVLGSLFDPSVRLPPTLDLGSRPEQMQWFEVNSSIKIGPQSLADKARESTQKSASLLKEAAKQEKSYGLDKAYEESRMDEFLSALALSLVRVMKHNMRLCFLKAKGRAGGVKAGFVHPNAELNDVVAIIKGCDAPVVLRADRLLENGRTGYRVIGEANIACSTPERWGMIHLV